jgi:CIC family chloride channel protein
MIYVILIALVTSTVSFLFNTVLSQLIIIILNINDYFFNALYFPVFGGVILGLMNKYLIKKNRAFEVVAIEEEIKHIEEHLLEVKSVLLKTLASIVSLAFGFSLGKQGTIVYLGGAIGSYFGYHTNQSTEEIKTLIGCGVSGMISGIFGMPLLGIVLVNEVIIKERQLKRTLYISLTAVITFLINHFILKVDSFITLFSQNEITINLNLYLLFMMITLDKLCYYLFLFCF